MACENATLRAERDALKKQIAAYDRWLERGVYFTNEEFATHLAEK
jgi:hypothetical protein